jgi:hypothetical protein
MPEHPPKRERSKRERERYPSTMPLTRESSNRQNKQLTEQATDQTSNRQKKIKHIERKATDGEKQPMEKSNQWRKATDGEKQPMEIIIYKTKTK